MPTEPFQWWVRTLTVLGVCVLEGVAIGRRVAAQEAIRDGTSARQVLELAPEEVRKTKPSVRLRGVVTLHSRVPPWFIIQDETGAVLVVPRDATLALRSGDKVEVSGEVFFDMCRARIGQAEVIVTGSGPVPEVIQAPASAILAGAHSGQTVELEGRLRDFTRLGQLAFLRVAADNTAVRVVVQPAGTLALPTAWQDAVVRVRGMVWKDDDGEGFTLHATSPDHLTVLEKGVEDLARLPLETVARLQARGANTDARCRLRATVSMATSRQVLLRDATGPLVADGAEGLPRDVSRGLDAAGTPSSHPPLHPGDEVEIVGAPQSRDGALRLHDATWRVVGHRALPPACRLSLADAQSGRFDCLPVEMEGRLVSVESIHTGALVSRQLRLAVDGASFEALLERANSEELLHFDPEHRVSVTGIVEPRNAEHGALRILLGSAADVRVLGPSRFFFVRQTLRGAVILLVLVAVAGVWIWLLRRQVSDRTRKLSEANEKLRRSEEELLGSLQRERALGDLKSNFVSLVSHEFRTPLAVILSSVEILKNHFDRLKPETRQQQLATVAHNTQHMSELIESVMILGRVEGGRLRFEPKSVELSAFCAMVRDEVVSATHHRNPIELTITGIVEKLAHVDEALLRHILTNLLTNAVKYSPAGAPVDFRISRDIFELVVEVQDRGIGIPEGDQARVFEAFHRAGNVGAIAGSGLGLVIVKRCVELHGGEVAFQSRPGKGTTFTVRLPAFDVSTARSFPRGIAKFQRP